MDVVGERHFRPSVQRRFCPWETMVDRHKIEAIPDRSSLRTISLLLCFPTAAGAGTVAFGDLRMIRAERRWLGRVACTSRTFSLALNLPVGHTLNCRNVASLRHNPFRTRWG